MLEIVLEIPREYTKIISHFFVRLVKKYELLLLDQSRAEILLAIP